MFSISTINIQYNQLKKKGLLWPAEWEFHISERLTITLGPFMLGAIAEWNLLCHGQEVQEGLGPKGAP